jgi:AmmeMemoRadiSam system protein A
MLTKEQKEFLLKLARESILTQLEKRKLTLEMPDDKIFSEKRGAFVTLHLYNKLRGCIGYVKPYKSIFDTINEMARAAAFNDPRFPQVKLSEMDDLIIEISILSELIPLNKKNLEEIIIGNDGLYIEGIFGSGLLLPQVAAELRWDRDTFLRETCRKAGLASDCYLDPRNQLYRFSADIFSEE